MKISTIHIRKAIVHLILGIIALEIISVSYSTDDFLRWDFYIGLLLITGFYFHSLILLPLLTLKKKTRKYILFTTISFLVFTYTMLWIEATKSSLIVTYVNGAKPVPSDFFFQV